MSVGTDETGGLSPEEQRALRNAIDGLREDDPIHSAAEAVTGWQRPFLAALVVATVGAAIWQPMVTAGVLVGVCTVGYVATMLDRVSIFRRGLATRPLAISDEQALAIPDADLPLYTILVPAYHEPEVMAELIGALAALRYPREKLQVLLLLEADDTATIEAARRCPDFGAGTIILVPPAEPRTKPKACNYGLHFATGEIITIYDAEDLPEPLQLRRVVAAFGVLPDTVACIQAKLAYHNGDQNLLTGWFTAEYALWFGYLLPGLMNSGSPIPLGGTSNHLLHPVLDKIGGWDPFNVTEDADLGLRIAGSGYRTAVVDSQTMEEANSDAINWIRQRSRWYKGYLQTWLVHMRRPVALLRTIGWHSFIRFNLVVGGTPIIAVLNLVFWLITILWFLGQPAAIGALFPVYVYFPALVALVLGNAATLYMNMIVLREEDRPDLLLPGLTVPLFWLMMSVAAAKGTYQLIRNPSYWEKTFHGLAAPGEGLTTPP